MKEEVCRISEVLNALSPPVRALLSPHSELLSRSATEIRLRAERPLVIVFQEDKLFVSVSGRLTERDKDAYFATGKDISDTVGRICDYSIYNRQAEISNGFITIKGGHRAGICGTAVYDSGAIINLRDISSLNLRIARAVLGCAEEILCRGRELAGTLICGEPASGKTTVLRDAARILSLDKKRSVSLIDERRELAACVNGIPQFDVGLSDVFDGYKKSDAMNHALRTMSPDYILCDEIGSPEDSEAIKTLVNCGVKVIATAHAKSADELRSKPYLRELLDMGVFENIVFLKSRQNAGKAEKTVKVGDLYAA